MTVNTNTIRIVFCRSNPVDPDPRVQKEASALAREGYVVSVIAWDRTGKLPKNQKYDRININRIPIRAPFANGLMNLPNLIRWQINLLIWLIRHRNEFDIIHACDFDTIIPALWMKRFWKKRVVYDIFDFYADHLRRTPGWIKRIIRRQDLQAIENADALILCDDSRFEQISGAKPRQVAVIYNTPEDTPVSVEFLPSPPGKLRLAYVGLLQRERMLFEILSVLRTHPEWTIDMAGFGGDEIELMNEAQNLPNVHWHGRVQYDQALNLNAAADLMFALYDPAIPNHRYSSANKIFEAMMLSKPVLVAQNTGMDQIVSKAKSGIIIPYGEITTLEAALTTLSNDAELRLNLGRNGRQTYEKNYTWQVMEERLINLYRILS